MKRLTLIVLLLLSSAAYSNETIILETFSTSKVCQNLNDLSFSNNRLDFEQFDIGQNDYLIITASTKSNKKCYSFKYYPSISTNTIFSLEKNKLTISEMAGSTLGGNQVEKVYLVELKKNC